MNQDEQYMKRCLQLAQLGAGSVAPNPMVGSVIVYNNKIIGEGYHKEYGKAHAEVNAVESVDDKTCLSKSTLYVNLEPCSHWGKTPPCTDLIIENRIPKVVISCIDTFSEVAGRGVERLQKAGVEVVIGILEQQSRFLNRRFFTFHEKQRPYLILKWAQTKDGFIDIAPELKTSQKGLWITNDICRRLVHKWRAEETAIMVGTHTAIIDNPSLTTRDWPGKHPLRISIDRLGRLPFHLQLFDGTAKTILFTETEGLLQAHADYVKLNTISPFTMLDYLHSNDIQSVIIEGGTTLLQHFIDAELWDEARVFTGDKLFEKGVNAPKFSAQCSTTEWYQETKLDYFYNCM